MASRSKRQLTQIEKNALRNIQHDKTKGMPLALDICLGMPVQCTKNISKVFKLANGSIGNVVHIQLPSSRHETIIQDTTGVSIHVFKTPPEVVYIKLRDYPDHQFINGLPPGVVPILPRLEPKIDVTLPNRSFRINATQVPIVPAFAITCDKCQGMTVEKMVLAPLRHPTRRSPQRAAFYVAVTRVKSMDNLYLMEPLTLELLQYFKPSTDVLAETARLQKLASSTNNGASTL